MENKIWLVYSREHNAWWKENACGYASRVEDAGRFTFDEATKHAQTRSKYISKDWGEPEFIMLAPENYANILAIS